MKYLKTSLVALCVLSVLLFAAPARAVSCPTTFPTSLSNWYAGCTIPSSWCDTGARHKNRDKMAHGIHHLARLPGQRDFHLIRKRGHSIERDPLAFPIFHDRGLTSRLLVQWFHCGTSIFMSPAPVFLSPPALRARPSAIRLRRSISVAPPIIRVPIFLHRARTLHLRQPFRPNNNQLTNGSGFVTSTITISTSTSAGVFNVTSSGNKSFTVTIPPKNDQYFAPTTTIPTNTNQLTNGAGNTTARPTISTPPLADSRGASFRL